MAWLHYAQLSFPDLFIRTELLSAQNRTGGSPPPGPRNCHLRAAVPCDGLGISDMMFVLRQRVDRSY